MIYKAKEVPFPLFWRYLKVYGVFAYFPKGFPYGENAPPLGVDLMGE